MAQRVRTSARTGTIGPLGGFLASHPLLGNFVGVMSELASILPIRLVGRDISTENI